MQNKINFIRTVLGLTKSGKLEWVVESNNTFDMFFRTTYNGADMIFNRAYDKDTMSEMMTYGLVCKCGEKIIVTKSTRVYIDDDKQEVFKLLTELGKLLDPDTIVPEVKVNLFDVTVNRFFQAFQ